MCFIIELFHSYTRYSNKLTRLKKYRHSRTHYFVIFSAKYVCINLQNKITTKTNYSMVVLLIHLNKIN